MSLVALFGLGGVGYFIGWVVLLAAVRLRGPDPEDRWTPLGRFGAGLVFSGVVLILVAFVAYFAQHLVWVP